MTGDLVMDGRALQDRLDQWPRLHYGRTPTPLGSLPNLTRQLGGSQVWIKRDDDYGPGMGGNKGRKLEFLMADALRQGKRKVVTFGGLQSNHARMTAAACAALGLEAHLFFFAKRPSTLPGNLLLDALFNAHLHFIPFGGGGDASLTLEQTNRLVKWLSTLIVGPGAYFMPVGGHTVTGGLGYVAAALELAEQVAALGLATEKVVVVTAVGTGGTLAGLMAGLRLIDSPIQLVGIDIGKLWKTFPASIARLAGDLCAVLGESHTFQPANVPMIPEIYDGPGYGVMTEGTAVAIRTLAQSEGIILDPVYTGKAFAGLLDLIAKGRFSPDTPLIFLHTGGLPGLWAFGDEVNR
ncbi:MAG TPA: pyridoxal-phosphate dependent enzyme [Chloroflexota bacterium]|nr:pyridoxal-phosphate dependent enzyme [Chloroflexota bacterium]